MFSARVHAHVHWNSDLLVDFGELVEVVLQEADLLALRHAAHVLLALVVVDLVLRLQHMRADVTTVSHSR